MEGQKSFKERVKETLISCAQDYKAYYMDYEYLLCSRAFSHSTYYIVSAHEDNYLHLTGVHTNLNASAFFGSAMTEHWKKILLRIASDVLWRLLMQM